jgi:hypothetical protein
LPVEASSADFAGGSEFQVVPQIDAIAGWEEFLARTHYTLEQDRWEELRVTRSNLAASHAFVEVRSHHE